MVGTSIFQIDKSIIDTYRSSILIANYRFTKIIDPTIANLQKRICNGSIIIDLRKKYHTSATIDLKNRTVKIHQNAQFVKVFKKISTNMSLHTPSESSRLQDESTRLQDKPPRLQDEPSRLQDEPSRLQDKPLRLQDEPPRL